MTRKRRQYLRRGLKPWRGLKRKKRISLWKRYGRACVYCDIKLSLEEFTVEHIIPTSKGGSHRISNLTVACSNCNHGREDRLLTGDEIIKILKKKKKCGKSEFDFSPGAPCVPAGRRYASAVGA